MAARIIHFPPRAPFSVYVGREGAAWLVICRDHGWLHGSWRDAIADAVEIARGLGAPVKLVIE